MKIWIGWLWGVLLVDADDVRRQQLGTVLSFMGIPWQEVVESDLDMAIETAGSLQGILAKGTAASAP